MRLTRSRRPAALVVIAAAAIGTAAATTVASAASTQKLPTGVWYGGQPGLTDSTGVRGTYDRAQGLKAAKAAGPQVALPKMKVGSLQIVGAVVSAQRSEQALKKAADTLGWDWVRCDAQGDPAKMESCGQSLLNQGVNVIFNLGVEPSIINGTLKRAKEKNVLVIAYGGIVTPSPLEYNFAPDEGAVGKITADDLVKTLKGVQTSKPISIWDFPAIWAKARTARLKAQIPGSGIEVKYNSTVDGTNVVDGTRTGVDAQLTQTPDLKGIWISFDSAAFGAGQAVAAKYGGKSFPDKPCIWTFHADQPNLDLLRKGQICVLGDTAYDNSAWIAMDQAAEYFARKRNPTKRLSGGYRGVDFLKPVIVKEGTNLPPSGKFVEAPNSAKTFFTAKWKAEFTK